MRWEEGPPNGRQQWLLLAGITLLAGALRLYRLGEWSFWIDEIFTLNTAAVFFKQFATDYPTLLIEHPLTTLLVRASTAVFGVSEWSARLPVALLGTLTIPILYLPLRRRFGQGVTLVALFLLAISPWHIFWSQNARFYVLLLLLYTLAWLTLDAALERKRKRAMLLPLLLLTLATAERLLALHLLPVGLVYVLLLRQLPFMQPPGAWRVRAGYLLLLGLLLVPLFGWQFLSDPQLWHNVYGRWVNLGPLQITIDILQHIDVLTAGAALLAAAVLLAQRRRVGLWLTAAALVPVLVVAAAALFQFVNVRYAFVALISWHLLAAIAAVTLVKNTSGYGRFLAVGVMTLLLTVGPLRENITYFRSDNGGRADWKAAFALVAAERESGDLVVAAQPLIGSYYLTGEVIGMEEIDPRLQPDRIVQQNGHVWVVIGGKAHIDPALRSWVEQNATLCRTIPSGGIDVYLYTPPGPLKPADICE